MYRVMLFLIVLLLPACSGASKLFHRASEPDGYWLPLTVDLRFDPSVTEAAVEYTDACGQRQALPIGERLSASLVRDMGMVFQHVHMPPTGQNVDGVVHVALGLKELDLFIPRQTTKSYPATVTVGATISYAQADGATLYTKNLRAEAHGTVDTEEKSCEVKGLASIANAAVALLAQGLKKNLGTSTKVREAAQRAQDRRPADSPIVVPVAPLPIPTAEPAIVRSQDRPPQSSLTYRVMLHEGFKNERLESGEQITMEIEVSNSGSTVAKEVTVRFSGTPELVEQFANPVPVGDLAPNEMKRVVISARVPATAAVRRGEINLSVEGSNAASADQKKFQIEWHPKQTASASRDADDVDRIPSSVAWPERKAAIGIAIGIGAFRLSAVPPVSFAAHDAELMAEYFRKIGGISSERMLVRLDEHALKDDLVEVFEERLPQLATAGSDVIIYIAGRAVVNRSNGAVSLIPHEADPSMPLRLLSLRRIYESLVRLPIARAVLIFDLILTASDGTASPAGKEPEWSAVPTGKATDKLVQLIGVSSSSDEPAHGRHGLLSYYVLKGLGGAADRDQNGTVAVGELCGYVRDQVATVAKDRHQKIQEPQCIPNMVRGARSATIPLTRYREP